MKEYSLIKNKRKYIKGVRTPKAHPTGEFVTVAVCYFAWSLGLQP